MSAATDAVASAILAAGKQPDALLPDVGVVKSIAAVRSGGVIVDMELAVTLGDQTFFDCAWSGSFALQVAAVGGPALIGKSVRVELIGGLFFVSDTVNWSAT